MFFNRTDFSCWWSDDLPVISLHALTADVLLYSCSLSVIYGNGKMWPAWKAFLLFVLRKRREIFYSGWRKEARVILKQLSYITQWSDNRSSVASGCECVCERENCLTVPLCRLINLSKESESLIYTLIYFYRSFIVFGRPGDRLRRKHTDTDVEGVSGQIRSQCPKLSWPVVSCAPHLL